MLHATELRRVRRSERNGSIGVLHDRLLLLRHAVHGRRLLQPVRGEMEYNELQLHSEGHSGRSAINIDGRFIDL